MKIELNQEEVHTAIAAYIPTLGIDTVGKTVFTNIIAGRGQNGITANVEILIEVGEAVPSEKVTETAKTEPVYEDKSTRKSKSAPEPEPEAEPVKAEPEPELGEEDPDDATSLFS